MMAHRNPVRRSCSRLALDQRRKSSTVVCALAAGLVACSGSVASTDEWDEGGPNAGHSQTNIGDGSPGGPGITPNAPSSGQAVAPNGSSTHEGDVLPPSTPGSTTPTQPTASPPAPVFEAGDPNAVGPMPLRRLTRREYNNTVRHLLGTNARPADTFPTDRSPDFAFARAGIVSTLETELLMEAAESLANETDLSKWLGCSVESPNAKCVDDFVFDFATAAYRRPATDEEVARLASLYARVTDELALTAEQGLRVVVQAVLQSPAFLYHWELGAQPPTSDGITAALNDYELASRLSYLVWAAPPDETLLDAASSGRLGQPEQLQQQVERLLADAKARSSVSSFFLDWAAINPDQVVSRDKDPELYPEFTADLAKAMADEATRFAERVVFDGDGTLRALLTGTTSTVHRDLATLYGLEWDKASDVGVISHDPRQRMGLFTQAAFLTVSGASVGSNPAKRGHKIYSTLLCKDVPPPTGIEIPPPAPPSAGGTTRDRFARHGENPCASCHAVMDPLGFAFEHYDGIGRFRTEDNGLPVDASGTYSIDGQSVDYADAIDLMQAFAQSKDVSDCVATQWLRYALRRKETSDDQPSVRSVSDSFTTSNHHFPTLIAAIANSRSFRFRTLAAGEQ